MNTYKYQFAAGCPENDDLIIYHLTIESEETILVEEILAAVTGRRVLHETLADFLVEKFGGKQTLVGNHSGIEITTVREGL
jgi:hypothetical protein